MNSYHEPAFALTDAEEQQIEMILDLTRRLHLLEDLMLCAQTNRRTMSDDFADFATGFKPVH